MITVSYAETRSQAGKAYIFVWRNAAGQQKSKAYKKKDYGYREAKAAAEAFANRQSGISATEGVARQTLADFGRNVLTDRTSDKRMKRVRQETQRGDLAVWERDICSDPIAALQLKKITRGVITEFLLRLGARDISDNTKGGISNRLRIVIQRGVNLDALTDDCISRPRWFSTRPIAAQEKPVITLAQATAARHYFSTCRDAVTRQLGRLRMEIAMVTGARPGEWLGMQLSDLVWTPDDPDFCAVWKLRSAIGNSLDGRPVVDEPKTKAGKRDLYLPVYLRPLLQDWIATQKAFRDNATPGHDYDPDAWYLLTNRVGRITIKQTAVTWWGNHRKDAGLPSFKLYDFRSSFSTHYAAANGITPVLRYLMGHTSIGQLTGQRNDVTGDVYTAEVQENIRPELKRFLDRLRPQAVPSSRPLGLTGGLALPAPANDALDAPVPLAAGQGPR